MAYCGRQRDSIDASRIESDLGWRPQQTFESGLRLTIQWYLEHTDWVEAIHQTRYQGERLGLQ